MVDKKLASKNNRAKKLKKTKPRINYKKKYEESLIKIKNLEINLIEQKRENLININDFQAKAKTFQFKAQKEVDKIKKNLNKTLQTETENVKKYGAQNMLESSLEIFLNIEIAIKNGENNENIVHYVQGFKMLMLQLYGNLGNYGVKKISPKVNENFNSKLHYAIETKKGNKNKIIEIKKEGFKLYDRVIKPATVVIGK